MLNQKGCLGARSRSLTPQNERGFPPAASRGDDKVGYGGDLLLGRKATSKEAKRTEESEDVPMCENWIASRHDPTATRPDAPACGGQAQIAGR